MVLNMTKLLDLNPSLTRHCNLSTSSSYSWEFQSVKVINDTTENNFNLYETWYIDCQTETDPTDNLSCISYNYYGKPYVTVSKLIIFSYKIGSRREELDINSCKVIDSAGKVSDLHDAAEHTPDLTQFIYLQAAKVKPIDCSEQPRLKKRGLECQYFCAQEPYSGREAHCVCPLGQVWDDSDGICKKQEDCTKHCFKDKKKSA